MNETTGLTRRSLLCAGATAGAAAALGVRPWAAAAAGSGYLTRSAYAGLEGTHFTVETGAKPVVLRLESVADVAGAASRRALVGSDDAFALTFSGPLADPLDSGTTAAFFEKVQCVKFSESPFDRRTGMAEVMIDTAGTPSGTSMRYLPRNVAISLRDLIAERSARTSFTW